ncbi:MAG TPA: GAF domain-containing protein [Cyclobacteriaceae bacterium]
MSNIMDGFPFKSSLNLSNIIGYWELRSYDKESFKSLTAKELINLVDANPILRESMTDASVLKDYKSILDDLMLAIFPPATGEDHLMAALRPFSFDYFYATKPFHKLIDKIGSFEELVKAMGTEEMGKKKTLAAYASIFQQLYGQDIHSVQDMVLRLVDSEDGLERYYKVLFNSKFCEIAVDGELPKLTDQSINEIKNNIDNLDIWKKYLPPERFEFKGFVIYSFIEITEQEIVSALKEALLEKDSVVNEETFLKLERNLRSLLRIPDLHIGISSQQKNKESLINYGRKIYRSLISQEKGNLVCSIDENKIYDRLINQMKPLVIENINEFHELPAIKKQLLSKKIKNLILAPLFYDNEFIGILELASETEDCLDYYSLSKLEEVIPLFAVAVQRNAEELHTEIQSIIKEQYTSIHPSVEWKFREAAIRIITQQKNNEITDLPEIVFKDVSPLYAAYDIRSSSTERNKAIQQDLKEQLLLTKSILNRAYKLKKLPVLDELNFRVNKHYLQIKKGLLSGDESNIIRFLKNEVEPVFQNLKSENSTLETLINEYWASLDADLGTAYHARKFFEESVMKINDTIATILDQEQDVVQKMYPHYFEKYQTDGVEYNIYIGSTLNENDSYDDMYLKNLQLWQLLSTIKIARKVQALQPQLSLPLEITNLILVHTTPLSIRFRLDEKKFDVDGAYNIRYEIVKKRIDKALIKGTSERLTQPNKIAIVYSSEEESENYLRFIEYLQNKGYIKPEVEQLDIEELQGVSGLKALRVSINFDEQEDIKIVKDDNQEELLKTLLQ